MRPGLAEQQLSDLRAIGLDWDGPVERQSGRLQLYEQAIAQLEAESLTYPCYCSRREVREAASAPQGELREGAYPGTCRELSTAERRERERSGRRPALRLRAEGRRVGFRDRLLGARSTAVDDLVVRRGDGVPAYNLAVAVDDAAQGVGEVVRGADLAESTPGQVLLFGLLGLGPPSYAHVPLVLGPDGSRLAKRHGAVSLAARAARGESPAEVLSRLATTLGLAEPGEPVTATGLIERFELSRLPAEPWLADLG